jgi:single-strand DNA-binding protein
MASGDAESVRPGLNRVTLIGDVGRAPELRYTPDGRPVASFALATRQRFVASDGAVLDADERFTVLAWGELAERCVKCIRGGDQVFVEGRLQTRSWEDVEGARHFMAEVVAGEVLPVRVGEDQQSNRTEED